MKKISKSIGARIRELRKENGESQEDIKNLLYVTRAAVANYENGSREPNIETLCILAEHFNVTLDYLIKGGQKDNMDLFIKIDQLKAALDRKDELKEQTKENNSEIAALKEEIAQMMIDAECPTISRNGFKYSLQEKVCYSKKSEEALQEAGIDFFEALRSAGFGDLIVETVNSRSLQSSLANYVDENDELPEQLVPAINVYEMFDIQKRKETSRAGKKKVAE